MDKFVITGGRPLHGTVQPSGNKNAALPMMAACLLTEDPVILHNMPNIKDTQTMRQLLESLGLMVEVIGDSSWRLQAKNIRPSDLDPDLCRKIRASILLAGPMVARFGELVLPPPGGDVIGRRRVDTHVLALEKLGAEFSINGFFNFKAKRLQGADILLDEASVTATENTIMSAVLAKGTTTIRNAASEPHIQELCKLLNAMGADVRNIGSNTLEIEGKDSLHGAEFTIGPDYLEVISFVGAAVVTRGEIRVKNAGVEHLSMIKLVLKRLGVDMTFVGDDILVGANQRLVIEPDLGNAVPEISVMPWPAFPTDLMSIAIVIATQSTGSILFHDWMYPSRMFFTDKLVSMGAQIVLCDPHRCIVNGPTRLNAEKLDSPDIRAGIALVLAALSADGTSIIRNVNQIDRGYERIDEKLRSLGAEIVRETA
ncbi:MAG: UDP-N-acetylglucosamine 1-carboxyvinyltransferase [Anaerolineaceae bacterium]|jgi:UDP-N-acetylglucosamine 1-carboxyvinyltransferase|nr:UDP-N-acetylglucosamine 1-carboxyvinyltransferase [Anaerolineaceae bacterium]MDI9530365.1 UDP-N-acetylglucosamine 1-carboxyvinyltransferase [Chloroflexota bacterium]